MCSWYENLIFAYFFLLTPLDSCAPGTRILSTWCAPDRWTSERLLSFHFYDCTFIKRNFMRIRSTWNPPDTFFLSGVQRSWSGVSWRRDETRESRVAKAREQRNKESNIVAVSWSWEDNLMFEDDRRLWSLALVVILAAESGDRFHLWKYVIRAIITGDASYCTPERAAAPFLLWRMQKRTSP